MHKDHSTFILAMNEKKLVLLHFFSKSVARVVARTCAPMDFGPLPRARDRTDRYHFWDFDSEKGSHPLNILPDQVVSIELLSEGFDPVGFVTWDTTSEPWFIKRDWGRFS